MKNDEKEKGVIRVDVLPDVVDELREEKARAKEEKEARKRDKKWARSIRRQNYRGEIDFLKMVAVLAVLGGIIWGVVSGVRWWNMRELSSEARAVWSVRNDGRELRSTLVHSILDDVDISQLIAKDHQTLNHAIINCVVTSRDLTSEHMEQFFSNSNLILAIYRTRPGHPLNYTLTETGENFAAAMNRAVMSSEQIMILVNNAELSPNDSGITYRQARFMALKSLDICMEGFRIVMSGFRYQTLECSLTKELFGEAFARQLVSDEFRGLPLTDSENPMQSQYGRISYAINAYGHVYDIVGAMFTPIERWVQDNVRNANQINSVVRWLER